jgi:hypothetical protein
MTGWNKDLAAALDQFSAPPPRASLVDDIVAAASTTAMAAPLPRSRTRFRSWMRRGGIGMVGLSLMSAAAAASGWLGEPIRNLPVISSIATVMPKAVQARPITKAEPKFVVAPKPKPPASAPEIRVTKPVPLAVTAPPVPKLEMPDVAKEARIEAVTGRLQQHLDARDARRAARGLAPNTGTERALLEKFQTAKSPDERTAARAELKALRDARKADFEKRLAERKARIDAGLPPQRRPICTPEQADEPFRFGCRPPRAERPLGQDAPVDRPRLMRRQCSEFPAGGWLPPRCRREAVASPPEQPGEPIPE